MSVVTCGKCSRVFEVSELFKKMVLANKVEAECPYCSGEHDDGANDETKQV